MRGRRRYATIGDAETMTVPEARREARRLIATFTETAKNDGDPRTSGHPMDAFAAEHVKDWFASMAERPGVANRAMLVPSMMRMAEFWGYRAHNSNPCKNARRYQMKPKERFLTADKMARLNAVLTRDEFRCPDVVAIVRLPLRRDRVPRMDGIGSRTSASIFPTPDHGRAQCGC